MHEHAAPTHETAGAPAENAVAARVDEGTRRLVTFALREYAGRVASAERVVSLWGGSGGGSGGYDAIRSKPTRTRSGRTGSGDFWVSRLTRERLRDYSRQVAMNNAEYRRVLTAFVTTAIGPGMRPQARTADREWNTKAERLYRRWDNGRVESSGSMSCETLQRRLLCESAEAGDVGVIFGDKRHMKVVESELIGDPMKPMPEEIKDPQTGEVVGTLADGVELSLDGEPVAYRVGRYSLDGATVEFPGGGERIPAHAFELIRFPGRFSATRGVVRFAHLLDRFEDLAEYIAWTIIAAKTSATLVAVVKTADPGITLAEMQAAAMAPADLLGDAAGWPGSGLSGSLANRQRSEVSMSPGGVFYVRPGEEVSTIGSNQPNGNFDPFTKAIMRSLAYGADLPTGMLTLDFSGLSFSTIKAELLLSHHETEPTRDLLRRFLRRVWRWLVADWVRTGELPWRDDMFQVEWIAPEIGWIDPVREVQADSLARDKGIITDADIQTARGRDLIEHYDQLAYEQAERARRGIQIVHAPGTQLERAEPKPIADEPDPREGAPVES